MALHGTPEIPECHVSVDGDGVIRLRHKTSGDTAEARTEEEAHRQAAVLRTLVVYKRAEGEVPFTTGDMP